MSIVTTNTKTLNVSVDHLNEILPFLEVLYNGGYVTMEALTEALTTYINQETLDEAITNSITEKLPNILSTYNFARQEDLDILVESQAEQSDKITTLEQSFNDVAIDIVDIVDRLTALENAQSTKPTPEVVLNSISATINIPDSVGIFDFVPLEDLKQYITVNAIYSDSSEVEVVMYTLEGTLREGTSTITVTYQDKVDTVDIEVLPINNLGAVYNQGDKVIYENAEVSTLKEGLIVTAYGDIDRTKSYTVPLTEVSLNGTLTAPTSIIEVSYHEITTTFEVVVTALQTTLQSISAVYTQGNTVITPSTSLEDLKANLVVRATYSNGSSNIITAYTLEGTLVEGTSTITVKANEDTTITTTFNVVVTAEPSASPSIQSISAVYTQGDVVVHPSTPLDDLKANLVVTINYDDGSNAETTGYTLEGTLTEGSSTIIVILDENTSFNTTFDVVVSSES